MTRSNQNTSVLLFDLGRVVIDIDHEQAFRRWAAAAGCDVAQIRAKMAFDHQHDRFERGEISAATWFAYLRELLGVDIPDTEFLAGWNAICVAEIPGMSDLLARARRHVPVYAFSNTNRAHQESWTPRFTAVLSHFRHIFASHDIGLRKPERAAFDHVVREIGVPADRILFFDDVAENVAGAKLAGLHAIQVSAMADVTSALESLLERD